jgi:hypothetical protein
MTYLIIILLIILIILLSINYKRENFAIPCIDPYSLYLHADATRREEIWQLAHKKKLYYYDNIVPQHFKE